MYIKEHMHPIFHIVFVTAWLAKSLEIIINFAEINFAWAGTIYFLLIVH